MARQDYTETALIPHGNHQNWLLIKDVIEEVSRLTDQWDDREIELSVDGKRNLYGHYSSVLDAEIDLGEDRRDVTKSEVTCRDEEYERYISITFADNPKATSWVYVSGPVKKQCTDLARGLQTFILEKINFQSSHVHGFDDLELRLRHLHPLVKNAALARIRSRHGDDAVEEACKGIGARLRSMSGVDDDGAALVGEVLGKNRTLALNNLSSKSDISEQDGYMYLGMALYKAARNPRAHRPSDPNFSLDEIIEWLSVASALHRALDRAQRT